MWPLAFCLLAATMLSPFAAPARAVELTEEQRETFARKYPRLLTIPQDVWSNAEEMKAQVLRDSDMATLYVGQDRAFIEALTVLSGVGAMRNTPVPPRDEPVPPRDGAGPPIDPRVEEDRIREENRAKGQEELYRVIGRDFKDQPWPYNESGKSAYRRKDFQAALRDYETAVRIDPTNVTALLGYGHSANELGDYRLAAMAAKQLL
ncbi:MAG: tetratricopeptide repeat protein, partial [Elusimicrobia bacterium]|nr:tetratricopeptide repeat protein [Elusimicrobiota bacterium]